MNWFERYGISGIYLVTFTIGWLYAFTDHDSRFWYVIGNNLQSVAIIGGVASLPIGYIVAIFAQWLYYFIPGPHQIHRASTRMRPEVPEVQYLHDQREHVAEAILSIWVRLDAKRGNKNILKQLEYLGRFITKRWDVIAINQVLKVATLLSPLIAIAVIGTAELPWSTGCWPTIVIPFITSAVIYIILTCSQDLLTDQAVQTYDRMYRYMLGREDWGHHT